MSALEPFKTVVIWPRNVFTGHDHAFERRAERLLTGLLRALRKKPETRLGVEAGTRPGLPRISKTEAERPETREYQTAVSRGLERQRCLGVDFRPAESGELGREWPEGGTSMSEYHAQQQDHRQAPWNKGRLVGQKRPLKPREVWNIRARLQIEARKRDLAMFNLAIDSKLRGCDLVRLKIDDLCVGGRLRDRATIIQKKTGRPVQFEITEQLGRQSRIGWPFSKSARGAFFSKPGP